MKHLPAAMFQHQEYEQHPQPDRRNSEEID
jgi:hypothetical protein